MGDNVEYDQCLLDLVFADLEHLLDAERQVVERDPSTCVGCGGNRMSYSISGTPHPGSLVCDECGVVQQGLVFWENMYGRELALKSSNYKRIHHWHERISQLLLMESTIPPREMLSIAEKLHSGEYGAVNKDSIRAVLRSLNMQHYIEKWLQIIYKVTGVAPPRPGARLLMKLDELFRDLQQPFECYRVQPRKNFLNYNYVFCRLFQQLDCTQFCMFFPLIKSRQKVRQLDDMWSGMGESLGWKFTPLELVAPFAVRLEQSDLWLRRLASECASQVPVELGIVPSKMVFRTLDRRSVAFLTLGSTRRRSAPPEREPRTSASTRRLRRLRAGARPR